MKPVDSDCGDAAHLLHGVVLVCQIRRCKRRFMTCRYIVILRGWTMTCRCAPTRLTGQLTKPID